MATVNAKDRSNHLVSCRRNIFLVGRDIDAAAKLAIVGQAEGDTHLIPDEWIAAKSCRDGAEQWHMTLLTKSETALAAQYLQEEKKGTGEDYDMVHRFCQEFIGEKIHRGQDWFIHGLGQGREGGKTSFFLVVSYPRASIMRRKLCLPPKDFHITIAFGGGDDAHECDKGIDSLINSPPQSLSGVVSSPADLVEAAEIIVLGGESNSLVRTGSEKKKHSYAGVEQLLNSAEILLCRSKLNCGTILECALDIFVDANDLKLARDILQLRCKLMGRKGLFKEVVECADLQLIIQKRLEDIGGQDEDEEKCRLAEASALGFKGFSLSKMGHWSNAYACLERSYELRTIQKGRKPPATSQVNRQSFAEREHDHEAIIVERILAVCCKKLGIQSPVPPLTVFPRTSHLFDSGGTAVSSDDLVISGDSSLFRTIGDGQTRVIVEEKIDGANMGFTLTATGEVIAQNRNHFISSGDHSQFGPLTGWTEQHRSALTKILMPSGHSDRVASQGLILFGEWMVAKHSIPYHRLPGQFVAFDLYDRLQKKFYSRSRFHGALRGTGIPVVPVIAERNFGPYPGNVFTKRGSSSTGKVNAFESDLRQLLETKSCFRSDGGFVEGVVLRIEENGTDLDQPQWLQHRAKIVRPDFVAGCQEGHWMRRNIQKQTVDMKFSEEYLADSYSLAPLPTRDEGPRKESHTISYKDGEPCTNMSTVNPRRRLLVSDGNESVLLQRNFSFMWANEVAISSTPLNPSHITAMKSAFNISLVVTLTEEEELPDDWFRDVEGCDNKFVPIQNYMPPSEGQLDDIIASVIDTVLSGGAVLVHCGGGKGRAGTVAACLLAQFGYSGIRASVSGSVGDTEQVAQLSSSAAIEHIRQTRPGSIETVDQEQAVRRYVDLLWKKGDGDKKPAAHTVARTPSPDRTSNGLLPDEAVGNSKPATIPVKQSKAELKIERERIAAKARARKRAPKCIILMGLPGSGKSTFSSRLAASSQRKDNEPKSYKQVDVWTIANQDRMGRKACEQLVGSRAKSKTHRVVLDRCNITESERSEWLDIMHSPPKGDIALIYFAANAETCTERVMNREDHETIPRGRGGRIVSDMSKRLEPPSAKEKKRFGYVRVLQTFEDVEALLKLWGAE